MIGKKNTGRIFGLCLAAIYGTLISLTFHDYFPRIRNVVTLLVFFVLGIGLYFAGIWVVVDRPAELDRKIPISSRELRRRTKEFYDWLASQGRR